MLAVIRERAVVSDCKLLCIFGERLNIDPVSPLILVSPPANVSRCRPPPSSTFATAARQCAAIVHDVRDDIEQTWLYASTDQSLCDDFTELPL